MLSPAILRQLRRFTLRARRAARERLAGAYESAVRGAGLAFADVRPYQPGDDVRRIDWNVTARTGVPHVKQFVEERERTIWLLVDRSASQQFRGKKRVTAEVAALLAFAAAARGDRVGLVQFTDCVEQVLVPKKGDRAARRVVREVFAFAPRGRGTSLTAALSSLSRKRRAVVFLVSDFGDDSADRALRVAARRHDLIGLTVTDPAEVELPRVGLLRVSDAELGGGLLIDTRNELVRSAYAAQAQSRLERIRQRLHSAGARQVHLSAAGGHLEALLIFFHSQERRR